METIKALFVGGELAGQMLEVRADAICFKNIKHLPRKVEFYRVVDRETMVLKEDSGWEIELYYRHTIKHVGRPGEYFYVYTLSPEPLDLNLIEYQRLCDAYNTISYIYERDSQKGEGR